MMIECEQKKECDNEEDDVSMKVNDKEEQTEFLQRILLDYLTVNTQEDNVIWSHAKYFYWTLWNSDIFKMKKKIQEVNKGCASRKRSVKRSKVVKIPCRASVTVKKRMAVQQRTTTTKN